MSFKALHKTILTKKSYIVQKIAYKITHIPKPKFPAENNNNKKRQTCFIRQSEAVYFTGVTPTSKWFIILFIFQTVVVSQLNGQLHHRYVNKSNPSDDDRSNQQPIDICTVTLNFVKQVFPLLHLIKIDMTC